MLDPSVSVSATRVCGAACFEVQLLLSAALSHTDAIDEAFELIRETIRIKNQVLGKDHPDTLASKNNLAVALMDHGQGEQAVPWFEEVFDHSLEFMPAADPRRMDIASRLAKLHLSAQRRDRAQPYLELILAAYDSASLPADSRYVATVKALGRLNADAGNATAARAILDAGIAKLSAAVGQDHEVVRELTKLRQELD